ncbi:uncharacterized protein LOC116213196 [Punica granatum]|uniref:Uncharacterized protein n=2 Tax=Punica granatum TaxID=22663 RepID=A0A218VR82_PUNGR|nr:uncharacterized protein LOC116213196 [Punica granatum]OWM62819.1 hypothetical protein CDL15_Pgr020113 [Punica granatum]PKI76861.1 hypothetical protein CRG98_002847 [Punica granatum]
MKLEILSGYRMASKTCSSVNRLCSIAVLAVLLIGAGFLGSLGAKLLISVALTSVVLLSTSLLFMSSKQNSSGQTKYVEPLEPKYEQCSAPMKEDRVAEEQEDCNGQFDDSLASESECINPSSTSEDSEVDWPLDRTPECSDGSISDEESLIEIAIPSGHYIVGRKEDPEHHKFYKKKMPDFFPDSVFQGNSLIDLLGEMNEEDNLIEIDISAGSIKCSRFGIKA